MPLRPRKSVMHRMIAEISKGAASPRVGCAAEPSYQTADDLWNGLKRKDQAAQLALTFAQRLRFNKRTRHSQAAAKKPKDKRWVRIVRQDASNLYLLMRQQAVPNRRKPGNTTGYEQKDKRRYDLGKQTPPQIQRTNRLQQHLKQREHWCLHRAACCGLTTGTGHNTGHTQTQVTNRKTVL